MKSLKIYLLIWWVKLFTKYRNLPTIYPYLQARLEAGKGFNSNIARENNNIFGMKLPHVRETTATGENRGHATYKSLKDSIKDYFLRQDYFNISANKETYYQETVNSGYAGDPDYLDKLNYMLAHKTKYTPFSLPVSVLFGIILLIPTVLITAIYFGWKYRHLLKGKKKTSKKGLFKR